MTLSTYTSGLCLFPLVPGNDEPLFIKSYNEIRLAQSYAKLPLLTGKTVRRSLLLSLALRMP